jgi:methylglutaconyl-CoA hydratase
MEAKIKEAYVKSTNKEGITNIEFYHPQSNSLPGTILSTLAAAIEKAGNDPNCIVIILRSAGDKAFCAGASFDELIAIDDIEKGKQFFLGFANVINAARKCPKFIIGRVQGKAVGGGVGMASAVDICFAHHSASIKLSELAVGIGPFVVGPVVERKIGVSAMTQLAINATEWKPSQWAKEKGLYTEVFENINELDQAVDQMAQKLAQSNPEAMRMIKKVAWENCNHWDVLLSERATMSGKLVLSDFTKNAIAKFKSNT